MRSLPDAQADAEPPQQSGGLLGSLLFGRQGIMGLFPQVIQQNGIVGSLVNGVGGALKGSSPPWRSDGRSYAASHASMLHSPPPFQVGAPVTMGQDVIPGQGDPHKPGFDYKSVPHTDILGQLFGGRTPA